MTDDVRVPAGAARYDTIGTTYSANRRPDPRWQRAIDAALGNADSVLNVGAGSGNYEPRTKGVVAVEPSETMLAQRPPDAAPAVQGVAERLPFKDGEFDVALAILTVHHWTDPARGLDELARVADRMVIVTWDKQASKRFWLQRDYLPELVAHEERLLDVGFVLERTDVTDVVELSVPRGCVDGFLGAMWEDPARYLDPSVRAAMSGLSLLDQDVVADAMQRLSRDIDDGTWAARNEDLDGINEFDAGFRLVTARGTRT